MICWECGQSGHLRKDCNQGRHAFALFSQEADLTCKAMVGGKEKALIDTGATISLIRCKDYFQIGFRENVLKIFQADGRKIKISGVVHVSVEVEGTVTVQQMNVTSTLCRSMILGRDWLQSNETKISLDSSHPLLKIRKEKYP